MYTYRFTRKSIKQLKRLDPALRIRIFYKLDFYCSTSNPLYFAEPIIGEGLGEWRFRIGEYRVIFDVVGDYLKILNVGHRRDIYR